MKILSKFKKKTVIIFFLLSITNFLFSQKNIDTNKVFKPNPTTASILSAIFPGAGQIYNKQYLKVPLIYTGFAITGYFIYDTQKEYKRYLKAYTYRTDNNPLTLDEFDNTLITDEDIRNEKDRWRRYRDYNILLTTVLYILNIVDASVYAHLYDYDVSDNLSFRLAPTSIQVINNTSLGIKFSARF